MKNRCEDFIAAKEWYKIAKEQNNKLAIEILESKFPELKESDDEEIRKELLIDIPKVFPHDKAFKYIAWLEKQGNLMKALQISNARIGELIEENYYLKEEQKGKLVLTPEAYERVLKLGEKKTAWSEEDETYLDHIITAVKLYYTDDKGEENPWRNELLRWLKSIKGRYTWKPSDVQMQYLSWIANVKLGDSVVEQEVSKHLNGLLEDLKKLREDKV